MNRIDRASTDTVASYDLVHGLLFEIEAQFPLFHPDVDGAPAA